jgi:hypothetical protein
LPSLAKELERQADEDGKQRVMDEIEGYEDAGLIGEDETLELLRFWQVRM